ncbi:tyrosine-type recombinase/integrase [Pelagibacterium halotolerans]|uniref:Putative integrase/recombinase n=1 Tax=Pelagibacterium halotolerans (strain DSM 22347 / JCM 15775 / CGMCC 1.7692 / B2) TaxID=1082931 RepID=G4RAW2_PELHB|nr:tyrosine-type recombinase/integrase [Pelagibacterium halotolerans]AEQ53598.1 putative integrase/recombinase [Pelagibacterium halotolerans B2]QJR20229.1 tyrosine-type recombinase/integrase [Pelagibacterium halotolerans]SEA99312.1 Site-specific recombinase XerD [Pelagibacterium halotolerans]
MTQLAPLITGFLRDYMPSQRGYSPQTCETYAFSFKLLFDFAAKRLRTRPSQLAIEDLDAPMIVAFLTHIEQDRGNSVSTRNLRLAAVKAFMRYVEYRVPSALEQIGRVHAIPVKRHDQKLIRHLTMEEVRAILNAPDVTTRSGVRDRAMMHLCFAGGLRVSELVGILIANLSLQHGASVTIRGKGRKERCLPLWKETARDLRAWLSVRGDVPVPELFVNARGEPMTRAGFEYILDKHVRKAAKTSASLRDRSVSPHQLRHSCAVIMLQATHDIRKVALWLGHADIRTTEVYLRMDPSEKLEAVEAVVPPELRRGRFKAPDALIASLLSDVEGPS